MFAPAMQLKWQIEICVRHAFFARKHTLKRPRWGELVVVIQHLDVEELSWVLAQSVRGSVRSAVLGRYPRGSAVGGCCSCCRHVCDVGRRTFRKAGGVNPARRPRSGRPVSVVVGA